MRSDMDSWARKVKSIKDIPDYFKDAFTPHISSLSSFPYTIYCPPDKWGKRRTNPKLICVLDNEILFLEKLKDEIKAIRYKFEDIISIEEGNILLYSWIKIKGITDNVLETSLAEFNTVVEEIFAHVVEMLRKSINNIGGSLSSKELDKFNYLQSLSYKYMNYGRSSVSGNEQVVQIIYQPGIFVRFLKFFKRIISSEFLAILTDKELIILKDQDIEKHGKGDKYGCISTYCPLNKIIDVTLKNNEENNTIALLISLNSGEYISFPFSASKVNEIYCMKETLKKEMVS